MDPLRYVQELYAIVTCIDQCERMAVLVESSMAEEYLNKVCSKAAFSNVRCLKADCRGGCQGKKQVCNTICTDQ